MVNIDKERINDNINDAYNNQSEKVKKLLESAKSNLADYKASIYDYTISKDKINQQYNVNRVITKNKTNQNKFEERINQKLDDMAEKININSKNLDYIFKIVSDSNENEINFLKEIKEETLKSISVEKNEIRDRLLEVNNNIENKIIELRQIEENIKNNIQQTKLDTIKEISKEQNKLKNTISRTNRNIENKIIELKDIEGNIKDSIQESKLDTIKTISQQQNDIKDSLLNDNLTIKENIISNQDSIEGCIQSKINDIQQLNKDGLEELKNDITKSYQEENKFAINTILKERNAYLKELQEKDMEIRQLNYKIYKYEEKLEKEKAKNAKKGLFGFLMKKQEIEEEEPRYTIQILNYI